MAEKRIKGESYKVKRLNVFSENDEDMSSALLTAKLAKFFGPGLTYLPHLLRAKGADSAAAWGAFMAEVSKTMEPVEAVRIVKEVCALAQIKVNGDYTPLVPAFHLRDESEAFEVFKFVLETQYGSFSDAGKDSPSSETVPESLKASSAA